MINIAIDGPAGAGKSTIAKLVAKNKGYIYVDTGAMYRTMSLACLKAGIELEDEDAVSKVCDSTEISIEYIDGIQHIYLNGDDVSVDIRQEEVGNAASTIAVYDIVRKNLVKMQQKIASQKNVVMDGRDIGSAVLPNADLKIYLTASARTRANRRYKELVEKGQKCDIDDIEKDIIDRDYRDMNRENSPLVQVEDAVLIDSSDMTIEEVVEKICSLI